MLNQKKIVSVILPCYNAQDYIEETILSVLNQTYSWLEIIIVDDCSKDKTTEIINNYMEKDSRIKLFKMKKNFGGPAGPRNYGLKKSTGHYVAFIDSDDIWHPSKIKIQVQMLESMSLQFCSTEVVSFKDKFKNKWVNQININYDYSIKNLKNLLIKNYIISGSSVLLRKNIVQNIFFNESAKYQAVEDYDFWLKVHEKNNISSIHLTSPLVFYRNRGGSISSNKFYQALKTFNLLKNFKVNGKKFIIFNYYYFFTYVVISLFNIYLKKNKYILK